MDGVKEKQQRGNLEVVSGFKENAMTAWNMES